jgi:hypothetical protein
MKLPVLPPALMFLALAACDPALVKPPRLEDAGSADAPRVGGSGGGAASPTAGSGGSGMAGAGGAGGGVVRMDAAPPPPPPVRPPDAARPPDVGMPPPPPPPPPPDAGGGGANLQLLFVTGSMAPVLSDMTMIDRLEDDGFDVVTRTDTAVRAADAEGKAAILLSGSTSAPNIMTSLANAASLATPMVVMDENLEPLLDMTGQPDSEHGTTNGTQVSILADANPDLSAGLNGNVTIYSVQFNISWGVPGPGALRIATVAGQANQVALYAYPRGAMMANNQTAPAKRVFFFVRDSPTANLMTDQALDLFSAAVEFATKP